MKQFPFASPCLCMRKNLSFRIFMRVVSFRIFFYWKYFYSFLETREAHGRGINEIIEAVASYTTDVCASILFSSWLFTTLYEKKNFLKLEPLTVIWKITETRWWKRLMIYLIREACVADHHRSYVCAFMSLETYGSKLDVKHSVPASSKCLRNY